MSEYPEHEKLKALGESRSAVQNFLDWLDEKGWTISENIALCRKCDERTENCECARPDFNDEHLQPIYKRKEIIMAEHFEIDLRVLEKEKLAMLDFQRELNQRFDSELKKTRGR